MKRIGNGRETHVWYDNWLLLPTPRPPRYKTDEVDLTLTVHDLIDSRHGTWDAQKIRHLFVEEDATAILGMKLNLQREDTMVWAFSKNGMYDSQSGYKLLNLIQTIERPMTASNLPPVERNLWSNLWKVKTLPKVRHFMWRALAGALAVSERLASRGINVETTCKVCQSQPETICHVLFHCPVAKEVWRLSGFPIPAEGFSTNSVFLNFHHLLESCKKRHLPEKTRLVFPWVLWQLWKSRNRCVFEHVVFGAKEVWERIQVEAEAWRAANVTDKEDRDQDAAGDSTSTWQKPCPSFVKCNIGSSWVDGNQNCGVAWLTRNHAGAALAHSRRSYSHVSSSLEAELLGFYWAAESISTMRYEKVVFESTSYLAGEAILKPGNFPQWLSLIEAIREKLSLLRLWSISYVNRGANRCADAIALSVTRDQRYASYIATDCPGWLLPIVREDESGIFSAH